MVYVLNKDGQPLMPTNDYRKVRLLLKQRAAVVVKRTPFTIRLTTKSKTYVQPITLGVDAGSKTIGISATTEQQEVFAAEVKPRNDVVKLLADRRALRSSRRNRTTRYRPARFNNRVHSKHKGWLAPSVEVKLHNHLQGIKLAVSILPISKIIVETAEFDTQRLKAMMQGKPLPEGTDYQLGELYDHYNVRQYVLWRDGYTCQYCGAKPTAKKQIKLHVHHLDEGRRTIGNSPDMQITLCSCCHKLLHKGKIQLPEKAKRKRPSMRDAAFMGIMRKTLLSRLAVLYPHLVIRETKGFITKYKREKALLPKSHINDALCISGNICSKRATVSYLIKPIRSHNRQIHKNTINKGGIRKRNQAPKYIFGFRLFDKVLCNGKEGFIFGRRSSGSFDIRTLAGEKLSAGISYKKLTLLEKRNTILIER